MSVSRKTKLQMDLKEQMFSDWMTDKFTLVELAKKYNVSLMTVENTKVAENWENRKKEINERLRRQNDTNIFKSKQKLLDIANDLITMTSIKIGNLKKNMTSKDITTKKDFIRSMLDLKELAKFLYLINNDGVERGQLDVMKYKEIELTDTKADKMLELLADNDSVVIDVESEEVVKQIDAPVVQNNEQLEQKSEPKEEVKENKENKNE